MTAKKFIRRANALARFKIKPMIEGQDLKEYQNSA